MQERLPIDAEAHATASVRRAPDDALIASIGAGDRRAMELLFARHNVAIYHFIWRLTGNASLAEEIVSEVFLAVWRGADKFKAKSQVSTWLLAIARHKALAALRRRADAQLDDETAVTLVDGADDPETTAQHRSRSAILQKCLNALPSSHREIIDLVYYHEKTVVEVAQIVGIPEGTVKTRMLHARLRMAELLRGAGVHGVHAC
jgi:RNA polymerase sigma-70 factor, ECF subfamily